MESSQFSKDFVCLPDDATVTIGQQSSCDIVVKCPLVSNIHCVINSSSESPSTSHTVGRTILDCSRNGTWLSKSAEPTNVVSGPFSARSILRVSKEVPSALDIGDVILLLAPGHVDCAKYRFELIGSRRNENFLYHLESDDGCEFSQCYNRRTLKRDRDNPSLHLPKTKFPKTSDVDTMTEHSSCFETSSSEDEVFFQGEKEEKIVCFNCGKYFYVSQLPAHFFDCASRAEDKNLSGKGDKGNEVEACPNCGTVLPVTQLPLHCLMCTEQYQISEEHDSGRGIGVKDEEKLKKEIVVLNEDNGRHHDEGEKGSEEGEVGKEESEEQEVVGDSNEEVKVDINVTKDEKNKEEGREGKEKKKEKEERKDDGNEHENEERKDEEKEEVIEEKGRGASLLCPSTSYEQCPKCHGLFSVVELVHHHSRCLGLKPLPTVLPGKVELEEEDTSDYKKDVEGRGTGLLHSSLSLEQCPKCLELFPVPDLVAHHQECAGRDVIVEKLSPNHSGGTEVQECPSCSNIFTLEELVMHYEGCGKAASKTDIGGIPCSAPIVAFPHDKVTETDGPRKSAAMSASLDCSDRAHSRSSDVDVVGTTTSVDNMLELKRCEYCLEDYPLCELLKHHAVCTEKSKEIGSEGVIGGEEVWGEPVERCMHCFKDFPLSKMVQHSNECTEDLLGNRDRFKTFLPSIHDVDPMAFAVLTDAQRKAVEYVREVSRKESLSVRDRLLAKVIALGFTEKDLEKTLQWIHRDAPIIIHLNLDRTLLFLVADTHYRNLFETSTGGGNLSTKSRAAKEDKIFNGIYSKYRAPPFDRVKYGVLNIVGDPRGVKRCYSYGDSFLQLKKVRLRTTFASQNTFESAVILSCCEHYGNVLYKYTDRELKAIIEVATGRKMFLKSDVISHYKEVQIHGPVCLSENVECIVVNERHQGDPNMGKLLDQFMKKNSCNLIWMEQEHRIDYPV